MKLFVASTSYNEKSFQVFPWLVRNFFLSDRKNLISTFSLVFICNTVLIRDFFPLFLFVKDKNSGFPLDFYIAVLFQVFDCPHACDETHLGCHQSVLPAMRPEFQLKTERLCSHSYKAPWLNGRLADCFRNGQLWGPPTPLHFCKAGDWRMLIHMSHILYY